MVGACCSVPKENTMPDLKAMLKTVTDKFAKTQVIKPEAVQRMEKVMEAAKEAAKTKQRVL